MISNCPKYTAMPYALLSMSSLILCMSYGFNSPSRHVFIILIIKFNLFPLTKLATPIKPPPPFGVIDEKSGPTVDMLGQWK